MVAFGLALAGGVLMLVVPYVALSVVLRGRILQFSGPACLNLFCLYVPEWFGTWIVMMILWLFSGLATIFVALLLRVRGRRWHNALGAVLMALALAHWSGLAIFLASGFFAFLDPDQSLLPIVSTSLSIGPLLALSDGILVLKGI